MIEFVSEKYGKIIVYWEYKLHDQGLPWIHYEWNIYLKAPVHLYDFVDYRPKGYGYVYLSDGKCQEIWHDEWVGTTILTDPYNWRLDMKREDIPTEETVLQAIDEEIQDAIDNYDGVVNFEKIVGVK